MKLTTKQLRRIIKEEFDDMMGSSPEDASEGLMIKLAKIVETESKAGDFQLPMANDLFDNLASDPDFRVSVKGIKHLSDVLKKLYREIEEKLKTSTSGDPFEGASEKYHLNALRNKVIEYVDFS